MKTSLFRVIIIFFFVNCWISISIVLAASSDATLLKAKKEAEAKGYIFDTTHDEIVAKAKKEGFVQVLSGLDPNVYPQMISSFRKKYPSLNAVMLEITGPDAAQRFIQELKSGGGEEFDIIHASTDFYPNYPPFAKKFDILGMAKHGVLSIPTKMVDPKERNFVAMGTQLSVGAYNKNLIPPGKIPDTWEDYLKPEFKGRKFVVDIRPHVFAAFPACADEGLGLEWMLKFGRAIRDQDPIWFRGNTRALTAIIAGEYPLHMATHYNSAVRAVRKDPTGSLQIKFVEPIPVRLVEMDTVLATSSHPHAALLFMEHEASPEGQRIIDKYEPLKGSIYGPGSEVAKKIAGKRLCVNSFETYHKSSKWMSMAVEAFGFPKPERPKR